MMYLGDAVLGVETKLPPEEIITIVEHALCGAGRPMKMLTARWGRVDDGRDPSYAELELQHLPGHDLHGSGGIATRFGRAVSAVGLVLACEVWPNKDKGMATGLSQAVRFTPWRTSGFAAVARNQLRKEIALVASRILERDPAADLTWNPAYRPR